jgi:hypothetical protein
VFGWLLKRHKAGNTEPVVDPAFSGPWPVSDLDSEAGEFLIHQANANLVKFLLQWPKFKKAETVTDVGFDWVVGEFKGRRVTFKATGFDDCYLVFEPEPVAPSVIPVLHAALLKTRKFQRL